MNNHEFIFTPGQWIGEGRITFNTSSQHLKFYTKWTVSEGKNGIISCQQQVEMEGREEDLWNAFAFSEITSKSFLVELSSEVIGMVVGQGIIDQTIIAWEFRGNHDFEGFEVYDLQENGDYMLHAEYMGIEQMRTIIDGRVWKKSV